MKRIWAILMAFAVVISGMMVQPQTAQAAVKVTSITLSAKKQTIAVKQSITLKVKSVKPAKASKKVKWKTSNAKVATVSTKGKVTGKATGTATITATSTVTKTKKATCKITVVPRITKVAYKKTAYSVKKGAKLKMASQFVVTPSKAIKTATWKSNKKSVALINAKTGVITAKARGIATITATATDGSKKKVTAKVVVTDSKTKKAKSIALSKKSATLNVKGTLTLKATLKPATVKKNVVSYSSSKTSVATVSATGKITAVAKGTATITAMAEDGSKKKATCKITVVQPVTSVAVTPTSAKVEEGKTVALRATVAPATANVKTVTWSSSNANIASVSATGVVTAKVAGVAKIAAKSNNGKIAYSTITVVKKPVTTVKVTGVSLKKSATEIAVDANETLEASVLPTNATNKAVSWSSMNEQIATVDAAGKVTGVAPGKTVIKVETVDGKFVASCSVTISGTIDGGVKTEGDNYKFELIGDADRYLIENKTTNSTVTNAQASAIKGEITDAVETLAVCESFDDVWAETDLMDEFLKSIAQQLENVDENNVSVVKGSDDNQKIITIKTTSNERIYTATKVGENLTIVGAGGTTMALEKIKFSNDDSADLIFTFDVAGTSKGAVSMEVKIKKDGSSIVGYRKYSNSSLAPLEAFRVTNTADALTVLIKQSYYNEVVEMFNFKSVITDYKVTNIYGAAATN
jgi:uncharacterized protein YjdB